MVSKPAAVLRFPKGDCVLCRGAWWCRGSRGSADQRRSTASCYSLASDVPLGSLSSMVTLISYHTAVNKHGLPAELSNVVQHGVVMLFPAFGP